MRNDRKRVVWLCAVLSLLNVSTSLSMWRTFPAWAVFFGGLAILWAVYGFMAAREQG